MSDVDLLSERQLGSFWNRVDDTGECWLWLGATSGAGYGRLNCRGVTVYAHRVALELSGVVIPPGYQADHTCFVRACVRPAHLRIATPSQNVENRHGAQSNSSSGIRGVSWDRNLRKWRVTVAGKHIGVFVDLLEAERAAIARRIQVFTHNLVDRTERKAA